MGMLRKVFFFFLEKKKRKTKAGKLKGPSKGREKTKYVTTVGRPPRARPQCP
jgi:hypothetical protein